MTDVVQKLWGFCNTLRHDGINYGDYIEQLTYLLFLKLADEKGVPVPDGLRLGEPAGALRDRPDRSLPGHAAPPRQGDGSARRHLRRRALQVPRAGQPQEADPADQRDRVGRAGRRPEGRGVRGPAAEVRRRAEGRRPVLHPAGGHPRHRALRPAGHRAERRLHHPRSGRRHRRLPDRRRRVEPEGARRAC